MKDDRLIGWAVVVIFGVWGLWLIAKSLLRFRAASSEGWRETEGQVTGNERWTVLLRTSWRPIVSYRAEDGRDYTCRADTWRYCELPEGNAMRVRYDPNAPSRSFIVRDNIVSLLLGGMLALMAIICAAALVLDKG